MNRLPFDRVRSKAPLTDADYASIRRNVMRELERKERRAAPLVFRFAFAAAMVVVALLLIPQKTAPRVAAPHRVVDTAPQVVVLSGAPALLPAPPVAAPPKRSKHKPIPKPKRKPETQVAVRMEIQTGDPDVRIIWIAQ